MSAATVKKRKTMCMLEDDLYIQLNLGQQTTEDQGPSDWMESRRAWESWCKGLKLYPRITQDCAAPSDFTDRSQDTTTPCNLSKRPPQCWERRSCQTGLTDPRIQTKPG